MEALMDPKLIEDITVRFQALAAVVPLHTIRSAQDYDKAVAMLNRLLDAGAADERSPLADLANTIGSLIADFEDTQNPASEVPPAVTLRYLMEQHRLTQSDLPEIGSQGVVSEILKGKRDLNLRQIRELAGRFHVPATVFI